MGPAVARSGIGKKWSFWPFIIINIIIILLLTRVCQLLIECAEELGVKHHKQGTNLTIEGPRFSSRAESRLWKAWGADVVNMTTVPEVRGGIVNMTTVTEVRGGTDVVNMTTVPEVRGGADVVNMTTVPEVRGGGADVVNMTTVPEVRGGIVNMTTVPEVRGGGIVNMTTVPEVRGASST